MKNLNEGMKSAQEVINQLKNLINLEKSRLILPTNDLAKDKNSKIVFINYLNHVKIIF